MNFPAGSVPSCAFATFYPVSIVGDGRKLIGSLRKVCDRRNDLEFKAFTDRWLDLWSRWVLTASFFRTSLRIPWATALARIYRARFSLPISRLPGIHPKSRQALFANTIQIEKRSPGAERQITASSRLRRRKGHELSLEGGQHSRETDLLCGVAIMCPSGMPRHCPNAVRRLRSSSSASRRFAGICPSTRPCGIRLLRRNLLLLLSSGPADRLSLPEDYEYRA